MSPEKEFMSLEEVADLLGVNYQLIYKLVRGGELPAARIGKMYRITRADFAAYIEKSKTAKTESAVCSACGRSYASKLSVSQVCTETECENGICVDCWDRLGVRKCKMHQAAK